MTRPCSICHHPNRARAEKMHVDGGASIRAIALQCGMDRKQLGVHLKKHLPQAIAKATEAKEITHANTLLQQVEVLKTEFNGLMRRSKKDGDRDSFIKAGREVFRILELMAKVAGELPGGGTLVNVGVAVLNKSPEWQDLRTRIIRAVEPFPEARAAIIAALEKGRQP